MKNPLDRFRGLLGNPHRRSWVIDPGVQYRIIGTAAFFSLIPLLLLFYFGVRISETVANGADPILEIRVILENFQMLWLFGLPVYALGFAYATLRLSNRIAGPAYQIRNKLRHGRLTGEFTPVHLRKGDHLSDLGNEYNSLAEKLTARGNQTD